MCTTANQDTCFAADDGSTTGNTTCVQTCCATTYCSVGSTDFFNDIAACICTASTCKTACGGAQDYCTVPGEVTTNACNTCFNKYTATGAKCDPSAGTIATACNNSPACSAYLTCANGCP